MDNNNWELHLNKEYEFIHKKIKSFDDSKILLCHHESKALKYDLTVIGSFKIPEEIMLKVAKMRSEKDKF